MLALKDSPSGLLVPTIMGQRAFVPNLIPRQVDLASHLVAQLDRASLRVGALAGVGETIPNPHLLIAPFLRREAVVSSKIEGTQATISDLFVYEASERSATPDTTEVLNYVHALEHGIELLDELPICVRLVNSVHARLMEEVRGEDKRPGELRLEQNWIGPEGTPIHEARFIPPPPDRIRDLLTDWEEFANEELEMPPLVQCALMHYQFECIHPYADGNGRLGRLLIILFLCAREILSEPLLYLSAYFERNRGAYVDNLYRVSATGEWEPWLAFFLKGVAEEAWDALQRSRKVRKLQEEYRNLLQQKNESANAFRLLDSLFANPYITAPRAVTTLKITHAGAQGLLRRLVKEGVLREVPRSWPQLYVADELLQVIEAPI